MRLAYFSPLNPQPSGISDYSEELLPHLAAHADVELFVDGFQPSNREPLARFPVFDYRADSSVLSRLDRYDALVYHMGNDHRYHAGIFDVMSRYPGVVVFHDFALQDFFLGLARERDDVDIYLDEMTACHGERASALAGEFLRRGSVPAAIAAPVNFPLNCRMARAAQGIIVHSEWARERFQSIAPGVPVARIPMPVKLPAQARVDPPPPQPSRRVNLATFGLIIPGKGIAQTLRALSALRDEYDFRYTLVGAENPYFDVRALINAHGMNEHVKITDHVSLAEFERLIAGTDIALNLRERTVGETSASLCRNMAAGVPAIVSDVGAFAELPGDVVVKLDCDDEDDALLRAYLQRLISDEPLRRRIGDNARRHMLAEHDIEESAARYASFIRDVVAGRERRRFVGDVSDELSKLGVRPEEDDALMRSVAAEISALAPHASVETRALPRQAPHHRKETAPPSARAASVSNGNGHGLTTNVTGDDKAARDSNISLTTRATSSHDGRLPKIEGLDYKRAAIEYPRKLDAERSYYLRTKPFYNLAHKPDKHAGDGMDAETHRHFCDFANVAAALALPAGRKILDVGCGSGWLSEYFARLGYDVTGTDISDDLIEMARERVARVPYDVDHETPLRCRFETHDIEAGPLAGKFDAVVCYDSLHHLVDERAVFRHLAAMLDVGGLLFILEGHKPPAGSPTEDELTDVMRRYETLESPYSLTYLRELLDANGFVVVGDYVSVNGLFEREMLEGNRLPLTTVAIDYHYLTCKKVADTAPASTMPDSRAPAVLSAKFTPLAPLPERFAPGTKLEAHLVVENTGDTLWLAGQTVRAGVVTPAFKVFDARGDLVHESHGQPMLPRAVVPCESVALKIEYVVPHVAGRYTLKIDLVDQHICWFEDRGSKPFVFGFEVEGEAEG
ncbi:MAG: methyltransferase domain-containing protein [Pyrinomonadaceae bacterium]